MNALQFEVLKVALKQDATGYVLTVKIHPDEVPDELLRDFIGSRYMVAMSKIESDESGHSYFNRVKQAGMLCRTTEFQKWVAGVEGEEEFSEKLAADFIYSYCEIDSRTELNGNKQAQKLFDALVHDFEGRANNVPF
jgi:hypothetical protein